MSALLRVRTGLWMTTPAAVWFVCSTWELGTAVYGSRMNGKGIGGLPTAICTPRLCDW